MHSFGRPEAVVDASRTNKAIANTRVSESATLARGNGTRPPAKNTAVGIIQTQGSKSGTPITSANPQLRPSRILKPLPLSHAIEDHPDPPAIHSNTKTASARRPQRRLNRSLNACSMLMPLKFAKRWYAARGPRHARLKGAPLGHPSTTRSSLSDERLLRMTQLGQKAASRSPSCAKRCRRTGAAAIRRRISRCPQ